MKRIIFLIVLISSTVVQGQRSSYDLKKLITKKGLLATDDFDQYDKWQKDSSVTSAIFTMDNNFKDVFVKSTKDTIIRLDILDVNGSNWLLEIFTISTPSVYESFMINSAGLLAGRNVMHYDSLKSEWKETGLNYQLVNKTPHPSADGKSQEILRSSKEAMDWQRRVDEYLKGF